MSQNDEDKKLVHKYKQTNKALRQQLLNLNDQVDKLLAKKSNTIGLKKLPKINKNKNIQVIESEAQNLRKRLQLLKKDNLKYKQKVQLDYNEELRLLEEELEQKNSNNSQEKILEDIKDSKEQNQVKNILDQIQKLNDQISRNKKMQKQIKRQIQHQDVIQNIKSTHIVQRQSENKQLSKGVNKINQQIVQQAPTLESDQKWKSLKKQFLELKQSKQKQQILLYEENDNLRKQIRQYQQKIKQKQIKMAQIKNSEIRKARNYSTVQKQKEPLKFRYRNKNNQINYPGRTLQI